MNKPYRYKVKYQILDERDPMQTYYYPDKDKFYISYSHSKYFNDKNVPNDVRKNLLVRFDKNFTKRKLALHIDEFEVDDMLSIKRDNDNELQANEQRNNPNYIIPDEEEYND